jgi:hypothetical protein
LVAQHGAGCGPDFISSTAKFDSVTEFQGRPQADALALLHERRGFDRQTRLSHRISP